jgi:hypothetical protein
MFDAPPQLFVSTAQQPSRLKYRQLPAPPSSTPNPDFSPFYASGLNKIKHLQLIS